MLSIKRGIHFLYGKLQCHLPSDDAPDTLHFHLSKAFSTRDPTSAILLYVVLGIFGFG